MAKRLLAGSLCLGFVLASTCFAQAGQGQAAPQSSKPAPGQQGQAGQPSQAAGPPRPTPEQVQAFQAIQNELDPEKQIALVEDFVKKYPGSPLLTDVYFFGAVASQQKGKLQSVVDYGEKSLKANPDNLRTLLVMSSVLPQPQVLQGAEGDKEKKLTEAEADANHAIQLLGTVQKPPNQTDEQFQKMKQSLTGGVHASLGMVHLQRSQEALQGPDKAELAKAQQEYKVAIASGNPDPQDYYRLGEAYEMDGKIDEALEAFTKASQLGQGGPLQAYADKQVERLKQSKTQAKAPPKQ